MARKPATASLQKAEAAKWLSIVEARQAFPQVDFITGTGFTCFNIGANFRLIVIVSYARQQIIIEELITHDEYNNKYVWRKP